MFTEPCILETALAQTFRSVFALLILRNERKNAEKIQSQIQLKRMRVGRTFFSITERDGIDSDARLFHASVFLYTTVTSTVEDGTYM